MGSGVFLLVVACLLDVVISSGVCVLGAVVSVALTEALFRGLCDIGLSVDFFCVIVVAF